MNYLIYFLLTISLCFTLNEAESCLKNLVQFENQIGKGVILKVSCKSRDNNLGDHFLPFKGTPFVIRFHEAKFGKTEWVCTVQHGKFTKLFRAYKGVFFPRCGEKRIYIAKGDGIYLSKNLGPETLKYPWDKLP